MGRGTFWIAAAATTLLAVNAGPAAAEPDHEPSGALGVRVINNNTSPVQVWVEDARGRMRRLGRVAPSQVRLLEIPEEVVATGTLQVKVYTAEPAWSNAGDQFGVRTRALDPADLEIIQFWVEPDLARSQVELMKSTTTASRSSG